MDMEEEGERVRTSRVKELEAMVHKLEEENKQLLTKVGSKGGRTRARGGAAPEGREDSLEADIVSFSDAEEGREDDWLFVSPVKPPTPAQRRVTPAQWLSEGHGGSADLDLPSLDEVRKTLSFHMNEAENLSMTPSGTTSLPLRARQPLTSRTAQRYLNQAKLRHQSPLTYQLEEELVVGPPKNIMQEETVEDIPVVKWKPQANTEDDVPIVKWKPQANTEEDVPIVKWKPQANTEEDVPVIKWKPQANTEEDVPVIKWKPHANTEDDIPVVKWKPQVAVSGEDDVPVVKWKARQPEPPPMDDTETIPVVKWNARVPSEDVPIVKWKGPSANEDIPVVSWRTPVPKTSDEDIPVVRWKSQPSSAPQLSRNRSPARGKVRNMPVKAIIPSGRRQHGEVEDLEEEERGGYRDGEVIGVSNGEMEPEQVAMGLEEGGENLQQPQRLSRFAAHYSSPSSLSPVSQRKNVSRSPSDSPSFGRRPSPSGRLPKPVRNVSPGNPNLHSRSPSPPVVRYSSHAGAKSRSPSPSLRYTGQTGLSTSPRMQQRIPKAQLPSPASRSNHTPPGTSLVSPNTSRRRPSPSRPATDQHTPPSTRHPSGLPHPPSSSNRRSKVTGIRAPQQSSYTGLSTSSETPPSSRAAQSSLPAGGGKRGITPPGQGGRQRRTLPTPPSQDGSARKPPSKTTPLRRSIPQSQPGSQPPTEENEDSWLEGCF